MVLFKFRIILATGFLLFTALTANSAVSDNTKYEDFSWISPNNWEGAIFDVPTWFAKDMQYSGREVIRFHDGFYDAKSAGFWTYAFALLVTQTQPPTTNELLDETKRYFIGLARGLGDKKDAQYPEDKIQITATSSWVTSNDGKRRSQIYFLKGFDSFTTGKPIELNVRITTWLCSNEYRAIHYSISPHEMTHPLWKQLNNEILALKCS